MRLLFPFSARFPFPSPIRGSLYPFLNNGTKVIEALPQPKKLARNFLTLPNVRSVLQKRGICLERTQVPRASFSGNSRLGSELMV